MSQTINQQSDSRNESTLNQPNLQQSSYPGSKATFEEKKDFFENLDVNQQQPGGTYIGTDEGSLKTNQQGSIGSQGNLTTGTPGGSVPRECPTTEKKMKNGKIR